MIKKFILSTDNSNQLVKTFIFYILNLYDIIFTQFFLFKMPYMYEEINPVIKPIATDIEIVLIKIFIPLAIIIYWNTRYPSSKPKMRKVGNLVMCSIILVYILINLLHTFNTGFYIYIR